MIIRRALALIVCVFFGQLGAETPRLTILLVIDQLAYHEILAHKAYFTDGLKTLLNDGIFYQNAYHAHAMPETSVGHATLSTGAIPSQHGFIANNWITPDGKHRKADAGKADQIIIDAPNAIPAGPQYLMVDTLADQLGLNSAEPTNVATLSLKSHAAIALAGRLGNPYWFDASSGLFTTSTAYRKCLPDWLSNFNTRAGITTLDSVEWQMIYPKDHSAYALVDQTTYQHAATKEPIAGTTITIDRSKPLPFDGYERTPVAERALFDLALTYLKAHAPTAEKRTVLFLSVNNLDKVGHLYGPRSYEIIDTLYHLDRDIGKFLNELAAITDPSQTVIVLTADHGVFPILETLHNRLPFAQRVSAPKLIHEMNELLAAEFGIEQLVIGYVSPQFYLDQKQLASMDAALRTQVTERLKEFLYEQPAIRAAWTFDELKKLPCPPDDIMQLYKNQLYHGRSGDIIVQVRPYTYIDHFTSGTAHGTPYDYDTHVPLAFYRPGRLSPQKIDRMVYTTQVAPTLASLLEIPRPSASRMPVLHEVVSPA